VKGLARSVADIVIDAFNIYKLQNNYTKIPILQKVSIQCKQDGNPVIIQRLGTDRLSFADCIQSKEI
jgi:hypothetical protein